MILIVSEEKDITTDLVCHWLNYYNTPFLRFNDENRDQFDVNITYFNNQFKIILRNEKEELDLNRVKKVWFRRGIFDFRNNNLKLEIEPKILSWINQHIKR